MRIIELCSDSSRSDADSSDVLPTLPFSQTSKVWRERYSPLMGFKKSGFSFGISILIINCVGKITGANGKFIACAI